MGWNSLSYNINRLAFGDCKSDVQTMKIATSVLYGASAFACGFAFGLVRELVLIPRFGKTDGHLIEFPVVTSCVCLIGIFLCRWNRMNSYLNALGMGVFGVAVLLVFESFLALNVMKMDLQEYLHAFDVRDGELFPVGLLLMSLAPLLGVHSDNDVPLDVTDKDE